MSFDKLSYHKGDALNLPKGWEIKKLGEVCELSAGGDVPKDYFSEMQTEKFQIPIYANGEKNEGLYGYTTIAKIVKPSITVSARGTIGFSVKRLEPFFPIVRLIVVSPIDLKKLSLDFLDYALRKIDFKHSGSSIPQLTVPMIRDYEIPLPPLPEQQRIVSILDECFSVIERSRNNAEQNLKNAKALFRQWVFWDAIVFIKCRLRPPTDVESSKAMVSTPLQNRFKLLPVTDFFKGKILNRCTCDDKTVKFQVLHT